MLCFLISQASKLRAASAFGLKYDLNAALAQTHHKLTVSLSLSFFVVSGATATRAVHIQAQPAKTSE